MKWNAMKFYIFERLVEQKYALILGLVSLKYFEL